MNITEVHIRLTPRGKLRAFVSITIDDWFVVRGLKIIEKSTGELFVAMPTKEDSGRDICHPVHRPGRDYLTTLVLDEYERVRSRRSEDDRPPTTPPTTTPTAPV